MEVEMEVDSNVQDLDLFLEGESTHESKNHDSSNSKSGRGTSKTNTSTETQRNEEMKPGDKFNGTIRTNVNKKQEKKTDTWTVESNDGKKMEVSNVKGEKYITNPRTIEKHDTSEKMKELRRKQEEQRKKEEQAKKDEAAKEEQAKKDEAAKKEFEAKAVNYESLKPQVKIQTLIDAGMQNIWLVGAAGSGKSTLCRMTANTMDLPYLCISCGIGTSAAEFVGYKYPTREATKFAEYYAKPSIILIDEMTALDPAVAQVLNAALANGEIETTTGLVHRHPECIIIATSNTYGNGASRQYVANNQLDASTIDRFVGATIEIDYDEEYESQYDSEVVYYVKDLRACIKQQEIRRVASTRMIQSGSRLKAAYIKDWKELLIKNWSASEKKLLQVYLESKPKNKALITGTGTATGINYVYSSN